MLTAEEQWKIIQEFERSTPEGRRRRRRKRAWGKTLTEQIREMGGYAYDPDGEEAIRQELESEDTRPPLQHSDATVSDIEVSFGESYFWASRQRLFHSWLFQAKRPHSWIEEKDLPLFIRFALHRPIMDEFTFRSIMLDMNLELGYDRGDVRQPHTRPVGQSRRLLFGIDVDHKREIHPSTTFRDALPKGTGGKNDSAKPKVKNIVQQDDEDEDTQELVQRQLWTVYEHVQNGSVAFDTAPWHYRDAINDQSMSNEDLVACLKQIGIPTVHIPTDQLNAQPGSTQRHFTSKKTTFKDKTGDADADEIIIDLAGFISACRDGAIHELEAIQLIQGRLVGFELESNDITDILDDDDKDNETAALLMWESAYAEDAEDAMASLSSSSSSEDEDGEIHENRKAPLRVIRVPDPLASGKNDADAVAASTADVSKSSDGRDIDDMGYREVFKENRPEYSEEMSIDNPPTSPQANRTRELSTYSQVDQSGDGMLPTGTPRLKPESLTSPNESLEREFDQDPPRDRANIARGRSPASDEVLTTGLWGLPMPIEEARKLAHKIKLPQDTIDKIQPISDRKARIRRASHAKNIVTFPKSKRRASMTLHKDASPKSPRYSANLDLFAREGEDQETFVLSHFDRDDIPSEYACRKCLRRPCECEDASSPLPMSDPDCPKCLQQPCTCDRVSQLDQGRKTAPLESNPSPNALDMKSADRILSESPKQSTTLLAYLGQVLDEKDVLTLLKRLAKLCPNEMAVDAAKAILRHIHQYLKSGRDFNYIRDEDREADRVLMAIIGSSQTLIEAADELIGPFAYSSTSTTGDGDRDARVDARPDLGSSLLNSSPSTSTTGDGDRDARVDARPDLGSNLLISSPSHEIVGIPLSTPVASTADFTETKSDVTNDAVSQAKDVPLIKKVPPQRSKSTLVCKTIHFGPCDKVKDAVQPQRSQAVKSPYKSPHPGAAGDPSGAGKEHSSNRPSSLPSSSSSSLRPPPKPRPRSKKLPKEPKSTQPVEMFAPGFQNLPPWPPGLPEKAGESWMGMTPEEALEHAKKEAFSQRQTLGYYLEQRRAVRDRIKLEKDYANAELSRSRFFQSSNGLSGSSGTALNKLFDKYRGLFQTQLLSHIWQY